jgi:hypothetical protein
MRRIQAIAMVCMFATPLAFAQAPASATKTQLAQKLYDVSDAGSVFQALEFNVVSNIMGSIGQGLGDKASCPALQPEAQSFKAKMDAMFSGMSNAQFRQDAAKVYADTYTEEEMRQIVTFYQSPTGQKLKRVQSEVNSRIGQLASARAQPHEAEIKAAATALAANVQKIAATCPAAPAAQPPSK